MGRLFMVLLRWEATIAVLFGALSSGVVSAALINSGLVPDRFLVAVYIVYLPFAVSIVMTIAAHHPFERFGWPNRLTLTRLVLTSLVSGVVSAVAEGPLTDPAAWLFLGLVAIALALDGVDGLLARRLRMESPFGARFDMEVDALLILLLSLTAWMQAKAGIWVLLIGAMRYGFVAAGWLWPPLNRPLPPSMRRKAVCVAQGLALAALLAPVVTPPASEAIAMAALLSLVYSFAVDVMWLVRHRHAG